MMYYAQLFHDYEEQLRQAGEEPESLLFTFKALKGWSTLDYLLHQNKEVSPNDDDLLAKLLSQLMAHQPAQYILGWANFGDLRLNVDSRALIPRAETQELVDLILAENSETACSVLDIGTGSGAIALALKQARPSWRLTASDLDEQALSLARENADKLGLEVDFIQSNVFEHITGIFDIIVSNPPYIAPGDRDEVAPNVLQSEPHQALFADEDGYAIYRQIIEEAAAHLTDKGKLYFEIGYKQGEGLRALLEKYFPKARVRVLKDLFGKDRMVVMDNENFD